MRTLPSYVLSGAIFVSAGLVSAAAERHFFCREISPNLTAALRNTTMVARFSLVQQMYQAEWKNIPNIHNIYKMATKYTKWPYIRPNCHKIYQHLPLQVPPKFSPNWDFGFEIMPSGNPEHNG
jgi:hypothetical protein